MWFGSGVDILVVKNIGIVYVFVNCESCFLVKAFELPSSGLQMLKLKCKPSYRVGKGDSLCFYGSEYVEELMETVFIA